MSMLFRSLSILVCAVAFLFGCGGEGLSAAPQPTISSFTASPSSTVGGKPVTLTAVFGGGVGVITPGNILATTGVGVSVTPSVASQIYTLTVTGSTQAATAAVSVTLTSGYFTSSGAMDSPRAYHTATLLKNGTVLVVGGLLLVSGNSGSVTNKPLATAELYDPASGSWTPTGNTNVPRYGHAAALLPDGKVLVVGGDPSYAPSAELYDPATGRFSMTGNMAMNRNWPNAIALADGRVLVVRGETVTGTPAPPGPGEIFDEASGTFSLTGTMSMRGANGDAVLLQSGGVLIPSGLWTLDVGNSYYDSSELYNPSNGTFSRTGNMTTGREWYRAVLLQNGSVLVVGGETSSSHDVSQTLASAEIFDTKTSSYAAAADMVSAREWHTATLLPSGHVLVAGGGGSTSAELYDPVANSFTATGTMMINRLGHTATLLQDGSVLMAGGLVAGTSATETSSSELYH